MPEKRLFGAARLPHWPDPCQAKGTVRVPYESLLVTLRLILMRHAKSSWSDPFADDHDRMLNPRGREAAENLGDWLRDHGHSPQLALCSTAMRTRETLERANLSCPVSYEPELYHAPAARILSVLHRGTRPDLILLGHNPGIGDFAARILKDPPGDDSFFAFPTGATIVAEFAADNWDQVEWASGQLLDFILPRSLATQAAE